MAAPTEQSFASREELLRYVQAFSIAQGYAVVIQKSNVPRGQVWLRCDLGGAYRTPPSTLRKRKSSSRLRNCPFKLYGRRLQDKSWTLYVQNAQHNHEIARDTLELMEHPMARRLTPEQRQLVEDWTAMGARPAIIIDKLREQYPSKPFKVQDIYNVRNGLRRGRATGAGRQLGTQATPSKERFAALAASLNEATASQTLSVRQETDNENPTALLVPLSGCPASSLKYEHQLDEQLQQIRSKFALWGFDVQQSFLAQLKALTSSFPTSRDSMSGMEATVTAPCIVEAEIPHVAAIDGVPSPASGSPRGSSEVDRLSEGGEDAESSADIHA
ncbi:TPA: hypothetical protein N0F65_005100 [Lagenidium giganteum]|uniref:FAR1 domain-containing protein n=1 Tax=Lagenidium giganteum TaxID=4803 RepID=A0AAV2Z6F4_9STRA|nr:TPA: hypothetical protein N0F65_005100 [Lagenidium giganteum]